MTLVSCINLSNLTQRVLGSIHCTNGSSSHIIYNAQVSLSLFEKILNNIAALYMALRFIYLLSVNNRTK